MMKRLMGVMMVAGTLVGCGTPAVAPLAPLPVAKLQSVAKTSDLVITGGSQVANTPNNSLPIRTTITATGTKGGQPYKVVVKTFNTHYYYVPTADTVTVNGVNVPKSSWKALSDELYEASKGDTQKGWWGELASSVLRFSIPRDGAATPAAGDTTATP